MASAREVRERVEGLKSQVLSIAGECMLENKEAIVVLVIDQQYNEGVDGNNQPLKPYSRNYAKQKAKNGLLQGHTDYSLSGKMQAEMNLSVNGDEYEINSPVQVNGHLLSDLLKKRDTPKSFDLTDENKKRVWTIIKERFNERVSEVIVLD